MLPLWQATWGLNAKKPPPNWLKQYGTKVKCTSFCCMDLNVALEFLFYVCFLLNNSVCAVKATKSILQTLLGHTTQDSDLLLCVSLASASEWHSTEHGIKQLTAKLLMRIHLKDYKILLTL